ncbi:MAG: GTPase Era [Acidimicrobiia bacterium]|nr:GTPase Era [Acidimicrobiia bacterium]MCY4456829.1 GTPase Era [Acidimicrobiaceae bacterium]
MNDLAECRVGFVSFVGRPNAGKSTLLNKILGFKVSIVSDKPQTTRTQIRGILHRPDAQLVFVDTPGIHKPHSALNKSLNATAQQASSQVDVVCFVLDGTARYGRGDAAIAQRLPQNSVVVVTKIDICTRQQVLEQLGATAALGAAQWFPVSGKTAEGIDALVAYLVEQMPMGPRLYPAEMLCDVGDEFWVAELVREQLLAATRDELPHSIATRVTEWEWPRIRCEIIVERESQKPIVIGRRGEVLKRVGSAVRAEIGEEVFIELFVKVEKNWQRRADLVQRFGY